MHKYFQTDQITIKSFEETVINEKYNQGFVFTRINKGVMNQTRSLRIKLQDFTLSSENRRVLKHTPNVEITEIPLPIYLENYDYSIQKMAKDFYQNKFGEQLFSANKIKELLTDDQKSNFNSLLKYSINSINSDSISVTYTSELLGYCIIYKNSKIMHYCYPFYQFEKFTNNYGLSMMINAITYAKRLELEYFYIGSATRPPDKYKLDFIGLEWFDTDVQKWTKDIKTLKELLKNN